MKRDLRLLIPAVGIWCGAFGQSLLFGQSSSKRFILGILVLILVGFFWRKTFGIFLAAFLVGAIILAIHQSALQRDFFAERVGEIVWAQAKLTSDVREIPGQIRGDYRQRNLFLVEVKSIKIDDSDISVPLILFGDRTLTQFIPGDQVQLLVRVQIFSGYATFAGSLTQIGDVQRTRRASLLWQLTSSIRSEIKGSLRVLPDDARGLIPGLVMGDRSGQSIDLTTAMRRSGLTHLTAVSGANFAIVASLLLLIGRGLRVRGRTLWIGIALFLLVFIFLVRPSSSVLRAAVMTGVLLVAKSRGVRASPIPALAAAISTLLLLNPFYVRDAGFALSVFATAGLLFLSPVITRWLAARRVHHLLAEALAIPISATISCLPVIVALSGELSLISIFANFLVAPVISVITISGVALMVLAPLNSSAGTLIGWIMTPFALWITTVARALSALPFAALNWPQSWIGSLLVIVATLAVVHMLRRSARKCLIGLGIVLSVGVALSLNPFASSWILSDWRVFQCDVGQGDGMIIKTGVHQALVIDVGPDERAIDRCLDALEIKKIELLILTHFHADHVSGLAGAINGRAVNRVWISPTREPEVEAERVERLLDGLTVQVPKVGESYQRDQVAIRVVAVSAHTTPNDSSISILASIEGLTIFAAGDLELEGQARALAALKQLPMTSQWNRMPIDLMKATHHGSALQDPELIGYLRPKVSIFSVGSGNPYGHPSQSALELYGRYGEVFRTDQDRSIALAKRQGNLLVVTAPSTPWAL